jgi:stage II sporulation protein AA (anti-sigma F factor antagonist)
MQITTTIGPATILAVTGHIDADSFRQLIAEADKMLDAGQSRLVLDLHGVDHMSSAGLVALQTIASRAASKDGKLVLCAVNVHVHKALELSGFAEWLDIFPDRAAALASLGGNQPG